MKESTNPPPKEDWLLVRGLIRESMHWGEFPQILGAGLPGSRVECLDLPGTGVHHEQRSPFTIDGIVDAARTRYREMLAERGDSLEKASGAPRFVLALSLGAMVVLRWVSRYPNDFSGAVLINTSIPSVNAFYERLRPQALWEALRGVVLERDAEKREATILKLTSNNDIRRRAAHALWVGIHRRRPISTENLFRQLAAILTMGVPRPPKQLPILLLNSATDRIVDPVCSRDLQRRFGWTMRQHPAAGHDLPLDDPEWTVRAVRQWRSALRARARGAPADLADPSLQ